MSKILSKISTNILSIIISIMFIFMFIYFSILFLLLNKNFYYLHIKYLNLAEKTGYSIEDIKSNYDSIIDYFISFNNKMFSLETLPSSQEGIIHFMDVKHIFNNLFFLSIIISIILLLIFYYYYRKRDYIFLKKCSINCMNITILSSIIIYLNFDTSFTIFHKIFFRNNYWIFDEIKDPVIKILPQEFFRNCSIVILLFILFGSISLYLTYKMINKSIK